MIIPSSVAGIPCQIQVGQYKVMQPNRRADSDWDAVGYTEIGFIVLDRKGRAAPWLERKLTDADTARIETQIRQLQSDKD